VGRRTLVPALLAALLVALVSGTAWGAFAPPPRPDTAVADTADVLTPEQEEALRGRLRALRERTGVSFVVATVPTLDGTDIKRASIDTFKAWGVGGEENRGLLFTVYVAEAREAGPGAKRCGCIRFEVGRYLEGDVTDTATKRVLKDVGPVVVAGDFPKALDMAVDGIEDILGDAQAQGTTDSSPRDGAFGLFVALLIGGAVLIGMVVLLLGLDTPGARPLWRASRRPRRRARAGGSASGRSDYTVPSSAASVIHDDDAGRRSSRSYSNSSYDDDISSWGSDDSDFFGGGDAGGGGSDW